MSRTIPTYQTPSFLPGFYKTAGIIVLAVIFTIASSTLIPVPNSWYTGILMSPDLRGRTSDQVLLASGEAESFIAFEVDTVTFGSYCSDQGNYLKLTDSIGLEFKIPMGDDDPCTEETHQRNLERLEHILLNESDTLPLWVTDILKIHALSVKVFERLGMAILRFTNPTVLEWLSSNIW